MIECSMNQLAPQKKRKIQVTLATWKLVPTISTSRCHPATCQRCSLPALRPSRGERVGTRNPTGKKCLLSRWCLRKGFHQQHRLKSLSGHSWKFAFFASCTQSAKTQSITTNDYTVYRTCFFWQGVPPILD